MCPAPLLVELPADFTNPQDAVFTAALILPTPGHEVVFWSREHAEAEVDQADRLAALCAQVLEGAASPRVSLLGAAEVQAIKGLHVQVGLPVAQAVATVAGIAAYVRAEPEHSGPSRSGNSVVRQNACALRTARDRNALPTAKPMVIIIAQVQSTWSAVSEIHSVLARRRDVEVEVVAVNSEHDIRARSTRDFLNSMGIQARDIDWLRTQVATNRQQPTIALFYDPWDSLREPPARALELAAAGIRVAYVPYGTNVGAGTDTHTYAYNLPMHQLAWRIYARSALQKQLFARYCDAGASHVRILGVPKFDRMLRLKESPMNRAHSKTIKLLWNPHFSIGDHGWSTFDRYVRHFIRLATSNPRLHIIARPHFRLTRDLQRIGGKTSKLYQELRRASDAYENLELDTSEDYLESFRQADAMISDLSSLIPEFLVTGKPLLYLHRMDSPGVNEDASYFFEGSVALSWNDVQNFIDDLQKPRSSNQALRQLLLDRHFEHLDGRSAERIADDIVNSLRVELEKIFGEVQGKS